MEPSHPSERLGIVWATVFLTALIAWGLTITVFLDDQLLIPISIALLVGAIPAFITIPLLLTPSDVKPSTLAVGRVFVWLQALALLVACFIGVGIAYNS